MTITLCVCRPAAVFLAVGIFALGPIQSIPAAQPILSHPVWSADPLHAQITVTNCSDTSVQYVIQMSPDMTNWFAILTNSAAPTNFSVTVPAPGKSCFYRAKTIQAPAPIFQFAILVRSNFSMIGNGLSVDSFDSSNTNYSTGGQYDTTKQRANGSIAILSSAAGISIGNGNIYGHVYTGPGTAQSTVQIGPEGAVGDIAWNNSESGIEPGYWAGNFNVAVPDVSAPTFAGAALPSPTNGKIVLNGGNYTTVMSPSSPLVITAPTVLWVQGSFSLANISFTNSGSLVLYVGTSSGSGDSLSSPGNTVCNPFGFAANLIILGLPSLTSISAGSGGFNAAIYAPEANFSASGGGNSGSSSGSLMVNNITLYGHWSFHFDESLKVTGPFH